MWRRSPSSSNHQKKFASTSTSQQIQQTSINIVKNICNKKDGGNHHNFHHQQPTYTTTTEALSAEEIIDDDNDDDHYDKYGDGPPTPSSPTTEPFHPKPTESPTTMTTICGDDICEYDGIGVEDGMDTMGANANAPTNTKSSNPTNTTNTTINIYMNNQTINFDPNYLNSVDIDPLFINIDNHHFGPNFYEYAINIQRNNLVITPIMNISILNSVFKSENDDYLTLSFNDIQINLFDQVLI